MIGSRLRASIRDASRDDRGSMALLAVMYVTVAILLLGMVVDGGQVRASRHKAGDVAQEAARAAAQQVEINDRLGGSGAVVRIQTGEATTAALAVLQAAGSVGASPSDVVINGDQISVTARFDVHYVILRTGAFRTVSATRQASAADG